MSEREAVEAIARKLTKAQREALSWFKPCSIIGPYRPGYHEIESLGLVARDEADSLFAFITDTGLAVRDHLKGTDHE